MYASSPSSQVKRQAPAGPRGGSLGIALLSLGLFLLSPVPGITGRVISLYDATGHATAYIAEGGASIYLYSGKSVAWLAG